MMNTVILAQTTLVAINLRVAAFWAELDAAITRLHGTVVTHHIDARDYCLPSLEMQVRLTGSSVTATWMGSSPVLDARGRIDLRQSADVWLNTLATLTLRPAPVSARVQAASALLAAGFDSVAVSSHGGINLPFISEPLSAMAA